MSTSQKQILILRNNNVKYEALFKEQVQLAALVSLEELKALFKCRPFHMLNLIAIWVNPNDTSSVVNSIQFIFTMYNGLTCLPMK